MSKNHRGTGIRSLASHGRGTCAICGKTDIKVLWEKEINDLIPDPRWFFDISDSLKIH